MREREKQATSSQDALPDDYPTPVVTYRDWVYSIGLQNPGKMSIPRPLKSEGSKNNRDDKGSKDGHKNDRMGYRMDKEGFRNDERQMYRNERDDYVNESDEHKARCGREPGGNDRSQNIQIFRSERAAQKEVVTKNQREQWTGKMDFFLSCLGSIVGLGNVWRFPYVCFKNGGGSFLIPYAIMLFVLGAPIFILELTIGQYSAMAPVALFTNMCPAFKGLGYAMFIGVLLVLTYYVMIIGYAMFYMFASFTSTLPWQFCGQKWSTPYCFSDRDYKTCKTANLSNIYNFGKCFSPEEAELLNITSDIPAKARLTPSTEYFFRYAMNRSKGIDEPGDIQWGLALSLLGSWFLIFLCLIKGIKSSGKVVYFTATFPYVILLILLIRGCTLPGAYDGIKFYMKPDWEKLKEVEVWARATVQILFSLAAGGGIIATLASYNSFRKNIIRNGLILSFGNCLTSVFAGFAVFSTLGFMANELGVSVERVAQKGPGLAFVVYPDALTRLPISPLWAILFFFMLILLGLDSAFACIEMMTGGVCDQFPSTRRRKILVTFGICCVGFFSGLAYTTQGGSYVLALVDHYVGSWPLLLLALFEVISVMWCYSISNVLENWNDMMGFNPGMKIRGHLTVLYVTIIPLILILLTLLSWIFYKPLTLGKYTYPQWAHGIGWLLPILILGIIVAMFLVELLWTQKGKPFRERIRTLMTPTERWYRNARNNEVSMALTETDKSVPLYYRGEHGAYDNPIIGRTGALPSSWNQ